ncbi:MAG: hypothetical protein HC851_17685 [Acaryochloris sp. RU_4_1]|nr:hypothetical protein [Acaryochloris sp. RU_4_1]NJR56642.1 hypothetical protein [Acaryochloris sp. CRU_2_0]
MFKLPSLKRPLLILVLWVSVNPIVYAQSVTGDSPYNVSDITTDTPTFGDSPYNVGDLYPDADSGEGEPESLLDRLFDKKTQRTLFKVLEHGQRALKAAKIAKNVYQSLSGKRVKPALQGISDILVMYGIINPPEKTANTGNTPDANKPNYEGPSYEDNPSRFDLEGTTPREVYALARNARAIGEEFHQKLTQLVLSAEGQEAINAEEELGEFAQEEATGSQTDITEVVGISQEQAAANTMAAEQVQVIGATAQGDRSSQQILKRLALQQAYGSTISAQSSQQLAGLTATAAHQNRTMGALTSLGVVQNRKLGILQMLEASGNQQRAHSNFLLESLKYDKDLKQDIQAVSTKLSLLTPQIPGFQNPKDPQAP